MRIALLILCLLLSGETGASAQVAVIAHKSVPVEEISRSELLDFYTGDIKSWSNGMSVVVLDLKPKGEVRDAFYKYLGKTSSRMKSIWMRNMLSGEGDPPESLQSEADVLKKVATTPGAIGFVRQSTVDEQVKTLMIIGQDGKEEKDRS
jgi:ABC-type phosphate transport system substrate-binding protein